MGHPVTPSPTFGSDLLAQRQPDVNVRLYAPPYSMPASLTNQNWIFNGPSIYPLVWFNDGSFSSAVRQNSKVPFFDTSLDAITVSPFSFGETVLNGTAGAQSGNTAFLLYGSQLAFFGQANLSLDSIDWRGGTANLIPGITLTKNQSMTGIQIVNTNTLWPFPGTGSIGTTSFGHSTGVFCNMNYLGNVVNVTNFGASNGFNDFFIFPLYGKTPKVIYGWNTHDFDSSMTIDGAIPLKPLQAGFTAIFVTNPDAPSSSPYYITIYNLASQSGALFRKLTFDDSALNTKILVNKSFHFQTCAYGWLFIPNTKGSLGQGALTCVLVSPDGTKYSYINFFSDDPIINTNINSNWSGTIVPAIKLDPNGVFYVKPANNVNNWNKCYNSYALNLNVSPALFDISKLNSIALPELCGCQPIVNGVSF